MKILQVSAAGFDLFEVFLIVHVTRTKYASYMIATAKETKEVLERVCTEVFGMIWLECEIMEGAYTIKKMARSN